MFQGYNHMRILVLALVLLGVSSIACGYTPPIGIPHPANSWGGTQDPINDAAPTPPDPWTGTVAGYYYVDQYATGATDTANPNGYPGKPRKTIPGSNSSTASVFPAGSYVEIHGVYDYGSNIFLKGNGNSSAWSANVSGPVWFVGVDSLLKRKTFVYNSSYVYLDNIGFKWQKTGDALQIGSPSVAEASSNHISIRGCDIEGAKPLKTNAILVMGANTNSPSEYVVVYNSTTHDHGEGNLFYAPNDPRNEQTIDQDAHQIELMQWGRNFWVLKNDVRYSSGAGIGAGQDNYLTYDQQPRNFYVGDNTVLGTRQACMAVKGSYNVVFSSNTCQSPVTRYVTNSGYTGTGMSPSKCFGFGDSGNGPFLLINNTCDDALFGIHGSNIGNSFSYELFIIGNTFSGIHHDDYWEPAISVPFNGWNPDLPCAMNIRIGSSTGTTKYIVGNTVYGSDGGICDSDGSTSTDYIYNNIISNMTHSTSRHINISATTNKYLSNNVLYQPGSDARIRWGSTAYTTLASWQAGSGQGQDSSNSDPSFANINTKDFHIATDSPAKDSGLNYSSINSGAMLARLNTLWNITSLKDISLVSKPQNSIYDIGAYEYDAGYVPPDIDTTPPTHSGVLTVVPNSASEITVSWDAASDSESGLDLASPYKLVGSVGATPPSNCAGAPVYLGAELQYQVSGLTESTTYSYRLCAYDQVGNGSSGITGSATTGVTISEPTSSGTIMYGPTGEVKYGVGGGLNL